MAAQATVETMERGESAARAVIAAISVFAVFIFVAGIFAQPPEGEAASNFIIRTPHDVFNGIQVCVTAFLASGIGALINRKPLNRSAVIAVALGLAMLNFDPSGLWDYVRNLASMPAQASGAYTGKAKERLEEVAALSDVLQRMWIYFIFYIAYVLWAMVVMYSAYVGQFVVGFALPSWRRERKESTMYIAERAGVGLASGLAAGVMAAAFLVVMSTMIADGARQGDEVVAIKPFGARGATFRILREAGRAGWSQQPVSGMAARGRAANEVARESDLPGASGGALGAPAGEMRRLEVPLLLAGLTFFISAYIVGFVVRPRTSTWVACGAIVGLMLLAVAAMRIFAPRVPTEGVPYVLAIRDAQGVGERLLRYGKLFRLLEASPFMAAATVVVAALLGDWLAKILIKRTRPRERVETYRPL
jgi:hypothetical protein